MNNPKRIVGISPTRVFSARVLRFITILALYAMGCGSGSNIPSPKENSDIIAEAPAISQEPIFRDDFNGNLNPAWTWQNEDMSHYKVKEDGWLEIIGGDESVLAGGQQANLLWTSLPVGDFVILIHLKSQPLFDFQRAGILLSGNSGEYVSLNRGYCMECVLGGSGIFLEHNLEGDRRRFSVATEATDLYLMIIRSRGIIGGFYAVETGQWQNIGNIENEISFERVGLDVTNNSKWENGYDVVGRFDFFEMRASYHQKRPPLWDVTKVIAFLR
ncbi:MAG: hypothetical protein HS100_21960 [Anaerolineales bacterium]|nr:hypothetical protein [Anaerolineales bacterium]